VALNLGVNVSRPIFERLSWYAGVASLIWGFAWGIFTWWDAKQAAIQNNSSLQGDGLDMILGESVVRSGDPELVGGGPLLGDKAVWMVPVRFPLASTKHTVDFYMMSNNKRDASIDRLNMTVRKFMRKVYEDHKMHEYVTVAAAPTFLQYSLLGLTAAVKLHDSDGGFPVDEGVDEATDLFIRWMSSAHDLEKQYGIALSLSTGEEYEFKDLFRSSSFSKLDLIVRENLKKKRQYFPCEDERKSLKGFKDPFDYEALKKHLGYEPRNCFSNLKSDQRYYIVPGSLVLPFSRYEIASGSQGVVEAKISLREISELVNPNGPLRDLQTWASK